MPTVSNFRLGRFAGKFSLDRLFQGRSVRTRLLYVIGAVNLFAATIAGTMWVANTRSATRVEIEASLEVAQRLASATISDLASQGRPDTLSERLPLVLRDLRHVRILLMQDGRLTMQAPRTSSGSQESSRAPEWFASLVGPILTGRSIRVVSSSHADPVILIAEPADEIAEAWHDFSSLAIVWVALNVLVIGILYVVLGRVLAPLENLARGMQSLKGGKYAIRLKPPRARELASITDHFNRLAGGLDSAREENSRLYRELIAAQEQVRRDIANDLHDEAGACLFGIAANASSIRMFVNDLQGKPATLLREYTARILDSADHLKAMNRQILKQLRPGPLGQVKLALIVEELVTDLQRSNQSMQVAMRIGNLARSYGESVDLAIYRCIQEGMTAAIRSGESKKVSVDLAEYGLATPRGRKGKRPNLRLMLRFDGASFVRSSPKDLAIAIMEERANSLGGTCAIRRAASKETTIRIEIPIKRSPGECGLGP